MKHKQVITVSLTLCLAMLASSDVRAQPDAPTPPLGKYAATIADLQAPVDAAFDSQGRIVVVDQGSPQLRAFAPDGTLDRRFGMLRIARPPLVRPTAITFDPAGDLLWVVDAGTHRVHAFDLQYSPLAAWGERGTKPGQLNQPQAIAVQGDEVLIADTANHRVQVFDREGGYVRGFGGFGRGDGEFIRPTGIATDESGNIYVADADRHDIQKFSPDGTFLKKWGDRGEYAGLFARPRKIAVSQGRLYIADSRNHRVSIYDLDGNYIGQWGEHALRPREGEGLLETPVSVAVSPDGSTAVLCEPVERRAQVFARYEPSDRIPNPRKPMGFSTHYARFCDGGPQTLVIPIPDLQRVDVYDTRDPTPVFITALGTHGTRPGQFINITGVAYDPDQMRVLVSDAARKVISVFELDRALDDELKFYPDLGHLVHEVDLVELRNAQPALQEYDVMTPGVMAMVPGTGLLVADSRSGRIFVFDTRYRLVRVIEDDEPFGDVVTIREAPDGTILIADALRRRIRAFDPETGSLESRLCLDDIDVASFDVLPDGSLVVADGRTTVRVLGPDREEIASWGGTGLGPGEFQLTSGVVAHSPDLVSILDWGNHRIQVFDSQGGFRDVIGSLQFVLPIHRSMQQPASTEADDQ